MDKVSQRLLLRIPEAAALLGVGRSTVYQLVQQGTIPIVRIGRSVRVPAAALDEWVEAQSDQSVAARSSDCAEKGGIAKTTCKA